MVIYSDVCHFEDNGCFSQGDTEAEIVENAKEALDCYLESYLEKDVPLPKASKITDIKTTGKDFATYIECDISNTGKSVRKNVTLPEWLCRRAEKASVNFSQALQESLIEKLGSSATATS